MSSDQTAWWWRVNEGEIVPDYPPLDVTGRAATRNDLTCGRWCINTPAGPCDEMCIEDWLAEQRAARTEPTSKETP